MHTFEKDGIIYELKKTDNTTVRRIPIGKVESPTTQPRTQSHSDEAQAPEGLEEAKQLDTSAPAAEDVEKPKKVVKKKTTRKKRTKKAAKK